MVLLVLLVTGCDPIYHGFVRRDFDIEPCPSRDFELPERVRSDSWVVQAEPAWGPYCHGFTRYGSYYQNDSSSKASKHGHFSDSYVRLVRGPSCRLEVISTFIGMGFSSAGRQLYYNDGHPQEVEEVKSRTEEAAEFVADKVFQDHPISIKKSPIVSSEVLIGDDVLKWCGDGDNAR